MSFIQPSIEGPLFIPDPWDWTVDQVVSTLTDQESPLLRTNSQLTLPDAIYLAKVLRENDVTGLALLTEVTTHCLRDELGIKSLGYRASINHLIRELQHMSLKYQEQTQRSARLSSVGFGSQIGTPHLSTPSYEPRASSRAIGSVLSSTRSSVQLQDHFGLGQYVAAQPDGLQQGPEIHGFDRPNKTTFKVTEGKSDEFKLAKAMSNPAATASSHEERSSSISPIAEQAERHGYQGETIIIDQTGKKRRRLVLAQPDISGPLQTIAAKPAAFEEPLSSPETLRKDTNANTSFESNSFPSLDSPVVDEEHSLNSREPQVSVQTVTSMPGSALNSAGAAAEPGVVVIDQNGRKRMRAIVVHESDLDSENQRQLESISEKELRQIEHANHVQSCSYGRKAKRRADQIYLGIESMPVDNLIYGDVALGDQIDKIQTRRTSSQEEQPDESDDFNIVPNSEVGKGQRLYVNARVKYLLRDRRLSLKRDGHDHIGIIPYPDMISRKNCPLSMTIFSLSPHGVTSSRANRSQWLRKRVIPDGTDADEFYVADPVLVRDEEDDPEWRALEKWKFMDGKDEVLPVYGESDSEGEYDLETWREMEKEQGKIARPLGRSRSAKLNSAEVQDAIDSSIEQIVQDWTLKRLPKLKLKGWRLWTKSRRNRNLQIQIVSFTHSLAMLETRIAGLRKEIAQEEWSKTSQINKQCKVIQPSIFDREDCKWKILTLRLQKAPEKPAPATTQPRPAKILKPQAILADGEEVLTASTETSSSSGDDLDDFILDDADEDSYQPVIVNDDLTMADIDSDTLIIDEPKSKTPTKPIKAFSKLEASPSNIIDLTQQSDPVDPENFAPKSEHSFGIRTPPLYSSENDSELFQRSRSKKKPVFRMPPAVAEPLSRPTEIISLDSDSNEPVGCRIPALNDVEGITAMNCTELVERQDRKRLLIWTVAHTPASGRRAAFRFLRKTSMEASLAKVTSGLTKLLRKELADNADMDGVMRVAAWRVCWTIPVKVTADGLQKLHIVATLEDDDGYEPFYYFLLEVLQHYQSISSPLQGKLKKKRELIVRDDSDNEGLLDSQTRKRKYFVPESQETLDKRNAAQDRLRANEERRRREELKYRFTRMSTGNIDSSKVVVNPGKLADQDFIYLNPRFGNGARMKSHQEEGLQFLWREITSEHKDLQGCLLAQTMGLGKTMQVIALLVTLSEAAHCSNENLNNQVPPSLRESRTLILCPPALVENWWDECLLWPPLPLSDNIGELRKVNSAMKPTDRLIEIDAWSKGGGILLLGYDTFKSLIHNGTRISSKAKERKAPLDDQQHEMVVKALLERPTLVVADEAHQFKSKSSRLNLAMNKIKTRSRIALTGSPLNNNLGEYHSLIDWIAPGYLGNYTEFKATYEEPIREGLYQDSTVSQYRESRKILKALELEMEPKVHRANVSCLHAELKGKSEFVIRVPLTELQRELYCIYAERMLAASSGKEPGLATLWSWLNFLRLLCNHPKCYMDKLAEEHRPRGTEPAPQKTKALTQPGEEALVGSEDEAAISDEPVSRIALSQIKDKSQKVIESQVAPIGALFLSHKSQVLMNILNISQAVEDKILVFSHSIPTLDYIGGQLLKMHKVFVRIDGKVHTQKRQSMTKTFNEGDTNICLVSTRAGGQGLNLFGANRIVILDDHFNPMWEQQAIGRAYRIGQKKHVYVYRLTVGGTFEQAIQNQALFKEQLATRVVDKMNTSRSALKGAGHYLFPPKTVDQEDLSHFLGKDIVLDSLLGVETG